MGIRLDYKLTFEDGTTYEEGLIYGDMRDGVIEIMRELYPDEVAYVFTKEITDKQEIKDFCRAYYDWFIDEQIVVVYDDGDESWLEEQAFNLGYLGDYEEFKNMVENSVCSDSVKPVALEEFHPIFISAHRDTWYLESNDQDYLSKELIKFIKFWDDVLYSENLCFGFNTNDVEKIKISICRTRCERGN